MAPAGDRGGIVGLQGQPADMHGLTMAGIAEGDRHALDEQVPAVRPRPRAQWHPAPSAKRTVDPARPEPVTACLGHSCRPFIRD